MSAPEPPLHGHLEPVVELRGVVVERFKPYGGTAWELPVSAAHHGRRRDDCGVCRWDRVDALEVGFVDAGGATVQQVRAQHLIVRTGRQLRMDEQGLDLRGEREGSRSSEVIQ